MTKSAQPNQPEQLLLRLPAVEKLTGLKRTSIYNMVKANEFPVPVKLSARAIAWRSGDIARWQESRQPAVAA